MILADASKILDLDWGSATFTTFFWVEIENFLKYALSYSFPLLLLLLLITWFDCFFYFRIFMVLGLYFKDDSIHQCCLKHQPYELVSSYNLGGETPNYKNITYFCKALISQRLKDEDLFQFKLICLSF